MNYPLLALDAAIGRSYGCLLLSETEKFFDVSEGDRAHSQTLMPMLGGLLGQGGIDWSDLKMLALGIGPGSFTGLRIAAASLAGINASLQLPVLPFSSLAVTAVQADSEEQLYVFEDARAGEVFVGCYLRGEQLQEEVCMRWSDLTGHDTSSYTSAAMPPVEMIGWNRFEPSLHRGEAMAMVIGMMLKKKLPELSKYPELAYLQISQAEKNLLKEKR